MALEDYLISGVGGMPRSASAAPNAAFGLASLQPGTLSAGDPLYEYARTAPVLELKGNRGYETLKFQPLPNTNYRLVVGGETLGSASTPEQVAALVEAANQISESGGKAVDVRLQKEGQYSDNGNVKTSFSDVYANQKNNAGALEFLIPAALAAMSGGALAGPLAGSLGIGQAAATGLGAGLGSFGGKLALGSSLKDAAITGGITGLTAGALSGLGAFPTSGGSFGGSGAAGAAAGSAPAAIAPVAGEMLVTNTVLPSLGASLAGIGGGAIGSGLGSIASPSPPVTAPDPSEVVVTGTRAGSSAFPSLAAALSGIGNLALQAPVASTAPPTPDSEEAVVTATRQPPVISSENLLGGLGAAGLVSTIPTQALPTVEPVKPRSLSDYVRAGLGGVSAIQGLAGLLQGEQNIGGAGIGGFNPNAGTVTYQPLNRTQNTPTFDPFTYGQSGGEFRFFNDAAPQYAINQSTAPLSGFVRQPENI